MGFFSALVVLVVVAAVVVLATIARNKIINRMLAPARTQNSPITGLFDDIQTHKWWVIIPFAILLALDKAYHFSHGLLESKLFGTLLILSIFTARALHRNANAPKI